MAQQLQFALGSFASEIERYKPKDMIDFSVEYFKALQSNTPLDYKDLSGLTKFELSPDDEETISRLGISEEDLQRVINRREIKSQKEVYETLIADIEKYSKTNPNDESQMHLYNKFKTNTFKANEFLRFIDKLENVNISSDEHRIYFTKIFKLTPIEKQIAFALLDCDWNLRKSSKLREWKTILEQLDKRQKHTYYSYDKLSSRLEALLHDKGSGKNFNENEFEEILKEISFYFDEINALPSQEENDIYTYLLSKCQYERVILNYIAKMYTGNAPPDPSDESKKIYYTIRSVYAIHFEYLTLLDYYDYVLCCFIPMIKVSDKTSLAHREMESFLDNFMKNIHNIININFYEEKRLYYNIECVKYFLSKTNKIQQSKQVLIDIINMFRNNVTHFNGNENSAVDKKHFKSDYDLIQLILNEFYPKLVEFINKVVSIYEKYTQNTKALNLLNAIIIEYKSYSVIDQRLITSVLKLNSLFENDILKSSHICGLTKVLIGSYDVNELSCEIKTSFNKIPDNIISPLAMKYYNMSIKEPKYDFDRLKCINFRMQSEVISLLIKNHPNIKSTAKIFEKDNIIPNLEIDFIIEELFNFTNLFFKLGYEREMKDQLQKDGNLLIEKVQKKFPNEYEYVINMQDKNLKNNNEENETENEKLVETFLSKGEFQQKLILTFMNFLDDFKLETHYINIIPYLSVQYMKYKVGFVRDKILKDISIKQNAIFIHYINDELKHVNYKMFIHLNYDNSPEMFCSFTQEEKELISIIQSYLQLNEFYEMPEIMSMKECIDNLETDEEKVMKQLQEHYELVYEFINKLNNCGESPPSQNEFNIFKPDEQQLINAYIQTKNPNAINAYTIKEDNCNYFIYKQIIIAEFNPSIHEDIKRYYRKLLLFNSKALPNSLSNFISLVLDFPFDPNNTYMYQNFVSFKNEEQLMIIQEILCRQCLLAYHTLYYDNLSHDVLVNKIASTTELALANNENKTYINYFEKEMNYLLCYFKESLGVFINKLLYVDNQTVFKFTNEFSDKERDIIVKMLTYKSSLTKDEKYTLMKNELDNYLIDLSHNERIQDIINKLDLVLTQQLDHSLFIALCEYIKETFYEIDYIIEKISADCTEIDNFIMKIYLSFDKDKRIIIDKLIQCINETKYNKNLLLYKEEFDKVKDDNVNDFDIYEIIKNSFTAIKGQLISTGNNSEDQYLKLKETLNGLCADLFRFCEQCAKGNVSLRKLKAISQCKVDIIKLLLECDYALTKNNNIKKAIDFIKQLKLENN